MAAIDAPRTSDPADRSPGTHATLLAAEWPHVRIADIEVVPSAGAGEPAALVRACVHLGALKPADVQVELTAAAPQAVDRHTIPRRLWSMFPYHNDAYAFETRVPLRVLAREQGCAIEVMPSGNLPDGVTVEPAVERLR
jgi:hypothetical protein